MSFDKIFDLTAGVYFNFYNIFDLTAGVYFYFYNKAGISGCSWRYTSRGITNAYYCCVADTARVAAAPASVLSSASELQEQPPKIPAGDRYHLPVHRYEAFSALKLGGLGAGRVMITWVPKMEKIELLQV